MNAGGCGGECRCAGNTTRVKNDAQCDIEAVPLVQGKDGKCPCGKSADECCHKDEQKVCEHNIAQDASCESCVGK